jgi:hypothetical protein
MARPKLPLLTRISNGLRDDTIDPMAVEDSRCWLWQGSLHSSGYPRLKNSPPPHRVLFELHIRTTDPNYVLPTMDLKDSPLYLRYPFLADEKSRITNLVHTKPTCGEKTCINPYHRNWEGKWYSKPPDWNPKKDDPKDLREFVPLLPSAEPEPDTTHSMAADIADWLEPNDYERPFDDLFDALKTDFCHYLEEDIHAALTEILKGR